MLDKLGGPSGMTGRSSTTSKNIALCYTPKCAVCQVEWVVERCEGDHDKNNQFNQSLLKSATQTIL